MSVMRGDILSSFMSVSVPYKGTGYRCNVPFRSPPFREIVRSTYVGGFVMVVLPVNGNLDGIPNRCDE